MLSHYEALTRIKAAKLVAILRHVPTEKLDGVVEALIAGGVRVLEFTFDHDRADCVKENAEKIRHTVEKYGDRVLVGCGTALTVQEVEAAGDAGACLVISPNVDYGVIRRTRQLGMVSMPGALTPTEIVAAHGAGAARPVKRLLQRVHFRLLRAQGKRFLALLCQALYAPIVRLRIGQSVDEFLFALFHI